MRQAAIRLDRDGTVTFCDDRLVRIPGALTTQTAGVTAQGYLAKPFTAMQLLHRVKEILT